LCSFAAKKRPVLYVLLVLNALLAWSAFVYANTSAVALRIAIGLGYAFAPLLVALLFTGLLTTSYAEPTDRKVFVRNLEIMWCLTLTVAVLSLILFLKL
jgi:hypothetical protein